MINEKQFTIFQQFTKVFGSDEGQIVLKYIVNTICRYEQSELNIFTVDGKIDPFNMAARCGKRSAAIDILDCLKEPSVLPDQKEDEDMG